VTSATRQENNSNSFRILMAIGDPLGNALLKSRARSALPNRGEKKVVLPRPSGATRQ
jgi:hypothetical protein